MDPTCLSPRHRRWHSDLRSSASQCQTTSLRTVARSWVARFGITNSCRTTLQQLPTHVSGCDPDATLCSLWQYRARYSFVFIRREFIVMQRVKARASFSGPHWIEAISSWLQLHIAVDLGQAVNALRRRSTGACSSIVLGIASSLLAATSSLYKESTTILACCLLTTRSGPALTHCLARGRSSVAGAEGNVP